MEIFRAIARIKYKNNTFCVLVNKICQMYFIKELEDGSVMYPTEDEYKELNYIFSKKQKLAFFNIGKKYKIEPKVIMKGGKLLVLSAAIAILGVTSIVIDNEMPIPYETDSQEETYTLENAFEDNGFDFHSLYGYENSRIYRLHKVIGTQSGVRIIECQDFDEFSEYISTKKNPTYDEVKETLRNNPNVEQKYKKWLLEGLSNLEKRMPELNLTVLNYNMNRLDINETTSEELNKDSDEETLAGRFDETTGKAYFIDMGDEDSNKFIVYHEVLGHGMSEASFERDTDETIEYAGAEMKIGKERIVVSDSIFVMHITEDQKINSETGKLDIDEHPRYFYIGQGFEEGKSDIIAKFATGNENIKGHPYIEQSEQLRIICMAVGLSLEDYISQGGAEILSKKMQENDVQTSLSYILSEDTYVSAMKSDTVELIDEKFTFKENMLAFFKDYADNKIKNGESREKIVSDFSKILKEGGDFIHSTFNSEEIDYKEFEKDIDKESKTIERDD